MGSLKDYERKRTVSSSGEPEARRRSSGSTPQFVIQKHGASTLHYDFRIEAETFSDPDWIYERKLDGERALAFRDGPSVRLLSPRNRKRLEGTYPEVVDALATLEADDVVADGEIVAFEGRRTSFARLQGRMQPRYAGLRRDKSPRDVVREVASS